MKKFKKVLLSTLLCITAASVSFFAAACAEEGTPGTGGGHSHVWSTTGTDNGDGTHKLTCSGSGTCDDGGSKNEAHDAKGADGACSVCGYKPKSDEGDGEHKTQADHTWGDWKLEVDPTWDTEGKASRTCTKDDGGEETDVVVPKLSDSSVWTKDTANSTPATHTAGGKDIYTSEYGTVEVDTDPEPHTWGEWVFNPKPTLTEAGKVSRTCTENDGGKDDEIDVPALSDDTFWTLLSHKDATLTERSEDVYECEYGTVTVYGDPLEAPFANKTYYVGATLDVYTDYGKANTSTTTYNGNSISIDGSGIGTDGTGTPFISDYTYKFELVNSETGEVLVTRTSTSGQTAKFIAFIDFETGIMVLAQYEVSDYTSGYFKRVYLIVPADDFDATYDSYGGSVWYIDGDYKFAITYTYGNGTAETDDDVVHNIYIEGENGDAVYFGVSFTNLEGEAVLGENAYNSDYLYITDANDEQLGAYACTGSALVEVDGLEGEYEIVLNDDISEVGSTLFLSGYGTATLKTDASYSATYTVLQGSDYDLLVVVEELSLSYYLTFNGGNSVTLVSLKVTVTFDLNGNGSLDELSVEVVPGFVLELEDPDYDEDSIVFKGWYYDAECTNAVEDPFIPTASCTLYAKWTAVPAYVGTYKSENLDSTGGNKTLTDSKPLTISPKGEINGKDYSNTFSGNVIDYDPETQIITWVDTNSTTHYFIFDEASGTIATIYNSSTNPYFRNDIMFYSLYATSVTHVGIKFALPEHTDLSATSPNLRLVKLAVDAEGTEKTIVLYYNRIYSNVTLSDLEGTELTIDSVKNATSLVVKDATTNAILLALKATSGTLSSSNTTPLDAYFGEYTDQNGKTIVLDGEGKITYDEKEGTYVIVDDFVIGAYIGEGDDLVYYEITLDGASATVVAPDVTITLNLNGVTAEEDASAIVTNKNVAITLPTLTDSTGAYLFDGWFTDADCLTPVSLTSGKYTPSADATLYAHWVKKLTVHVHYNNAGVDFEEYWYVGEGKALNLSVPQGVINGLVFAGFYTSADCEDGYEWDNGGVITEASGITDIYVKWVTPVPYYGTFVGKAPAYHSNGHFSSIWERNAFEVDPYGNAEGFGTSASNKLTGVINDYDDATGKFKFYAPSTSSYFYQGAFDAKNGVIVVDSATASTTEQEFNYTPYVYFLGAEEVTMNAADTSLWMVSGSTYRFHTSLIKATVDGEVINVFIFDHRVWGNVTIKKADGETVEAGDAYNTDAFGVYDSEGKIIALYGDGEFYYSDGLNGTYSNASGENLGDIVLDGAGGITVGENKGTYEITADNTIDVVLTVSATNAITLEGYTIVLNTEEETYTATVKSLNKVTVTIIYAQDGLSEDAQITVEVLSGTTPDLTPFVPKGTNSLGNYFTGWFEDDARANAYTPAELNANKTVYAGWIEELFTVAEVSTGSYHWAEDPAGTWSVSGHGDDINVYIKITFNVSGTFTFDWSCRFNDSYDGIYGELNTLDPIGYGSSRFFTKHSGSGTQPVTVSAGDYLCICASWDDYNNSWSSNDNVTLSNFQFVIAY